MDKTPRTSRSSTASSESPEPRKRQSDSGGSDEKSVSNRQPTVQARPSAPSAPGGDPGPSLPVDEQAPGGGNQFILRIRCKLPVPSAHSPTTTTALPSKPGVDNGMNDHVAPNSPPVLPRPLITDLVSSTDLPPKILAIANAGLSSNALLAPDKLAALIVAIESKGRTLMLTDHHIKHLLRGPLKIHDFMPSSSTKPFHLNVVEKFCKPFMAMHLSAPEYEKTRMTLWRSYQNSAGTGADSDKASGARQLSDAQRKLLQPVLNLICGEKRNLDSSRLPEAMKQFLLSIDREIIGWFEANGSGQPADLYAARKNALISFLWTRSLGAEWADKLVTENRHDPAAIKLIPSLIQELTSLVASGAGDFIHDLMLSQNPQPKAARHYVERLTGKLTLKSKSSMRALQLSEEQTTSWDTLLSPRRLSRPVVDPEAKEKEVRRRLEHARYADVLVRASGIDKLDNAFCLHLKEKFSQMGKRGFDNVRSDPITYAVKYVDKFFLTPDRRSPSQSDLPGQLKAALKNLTPETHPSLFVARSAPSASSDRDEPKTGPAISTPRIARSEESGSDDRVGDVHIEDFGS